MNVRADDPATAETILKKLMAAQATKDYDAFVADGTDQFKAALTKIRFEASSNIMNARFKGGYNCTFLGELNQKRFEVYLYRLRFKDGGDDMLGTLSLKDGKNRRHLVPLNLENFCFIPMRMFLLLLVSLTVSHPALGDQLTPSKLDPKFAEAREKAFTSWGDKEQTGATWRELSSTHIPVYSEYCCDGWQRAIYIANPGAGYWALDGLSEEALWQTEHEKLKIGDELVSAGSHLTEDGAVRYWALWVPRKRAYLLKEKMRALGITPAQVDIDPLAVEEDERGIRLDAATLYTFSGAIAFHDPGGSVKYDLTITKGQVSGWQYWGEDKELVGKIVGGWFDFDRRRLSVMIQGADHVQALWRSQLKQFHLDIAAKQVILDYELYDYGKTIENPLVGKPHILDKLDRIEHLVK